MDLVGEVTVATGHEVVQDSYEGLDGNTIVVLVFQSHFFFSFFFQLLQTVLDNFFFFKNLQQIK